MYSYWFNRIIKIIDFTFIRSVALLINVIFNYSHTSHFYYFIDRLKPDLLNTSIFPLLVSGLADASPTIRELTVRVSY